PDGLVASAGRGDAGSVVETAAAVIDDRDVAVGRGDRLRRAVARSVGGIGPLKLDRGGRVVADGARDLDGDAGAVVVVDVLAGVALRANAEEVVRGRVVRVDD